MTKTETYHLLEYTEAVRTNGINAMKQMLGELEGIDDPLITALGKEMSNIVKSLEKGSERVQRHLSYFEV